MRPPDACRTVRTVSQSKRKTFRPWTACHRFVGKNRGSDGQVAGKRCAVPRNGRPPSAGIDSRPADSLLPTHPRHSRADAADEVHAMDRASNADLPAQIKSIMIRVLDLDVAPERLDDTVSLYSPVVGMDSLSLLHTLVEIEKEFGIEIDDEDVMLAELRNVGSLIDMISGIIGAEGGKA
ncbi:hypothetical protein GCM10023088_54990 [Actinomadura verrucosospora]